jgi:hypothetical protein
MMRVAISRLFSAPLLKLDLINLKVSSLSFYALAKLTDLALYNRAQQLMHA